MEVLTYKTTIITPLLQEDIIINNLVETDKICDPRYIMSAGTSWLRYHKGKNLYDLQIVLKDLGLNTIIIARTAEKDANYKLCLPGQTQTQSSVDLLYVADFVSNPHIITQIPIQSIDELEKLKYAGYSCSTRYAEKLHGGEVDTEPPDIKELTDSDIHIQLQWAGIKFNVENVVVNPDEELNKDLQRAHDKGVSTELRELTPFRANRERIFAHIDPVTEHYVSAFGVLEKKTKDGTVTSRLVVHLPTYLHELDEK